MLKFLFLSCNHEAVHAAVHAWLNPWHIFRAYDTWPGVAWIKGHGTKYLYFFFLQSHGVPSVAKHAFMQPCTIAAVSHASWASKVYGFIWMNASWLQRGISKHLKPWKPAWEVCSDVARVMKLKIHGLNMPEMTMETTMHEPWVSLETLSSDAWGNGGVVARV